MGWVTSVFYCQISKSISKEPFMENLSRALGQLREERQRAQSQLQQLNAAIAAIEGLMGRNHSTAGRNGIVRAVSAAARRRMAQAQRARWARVRQAKSS